MKLKIINKDFSICKIKNNENININNEFSFYAKTDEELSLVCLTKDVPDNYILKDDNYLALRIEGTLDLSLVGILAKIADILKEKNIPIFVISTFNTDYLLIKKYKIEVAVNALINGGYQVIE